MIRRIIAILICFAAFSGSVIAQKKDKAKAKEEEQLLETAEYYFTEKNYLRALPYYKKLSELDPQNGYYHFQSGICYLYKNDEKELAVAELEKAKLLYPEFERIDYYLGRAYHLNYRFDDAINAFNKDLTASDLKPKEVQEVNQFIRYCENAKKSTKDSVEVEIKNIGDPINTEDAEYVPVITVDESMLIYTYRGKRSTGGLMDPKFRPDTLGDFYEDIMYSQKLGDRWLSPEPIGPPINTLGHDASIALSNDGQILFIFKSTTKDGGDIFMSHLKGETWTTPERLGPNINTKYWEGSCSLSNDGLLLYFASDRPGGIGGRDIYVSHKQADGSWGPAENMGPAVNTPFNDDAPFIHPDGIHLFFSSEGHNSIGGYDIFYSTFKNNAWGQPQNMGYPLNTPANERYYVLSADGATGYYSSDRKDGMGQLDILTVSPGFQGEPPILALVVGFVTKDGAPVDAKINVTDSITGQSYGNYNSNAMSGKYLIALKPGNTYKVAIEVEGSDAYYEYVNVKGLDTYVQVNKDFNFVSKPGADSTAKAGAAIADTSDVLQKKLDEQVKRIKEEQNDQVYEARMYKQILKKYGSNYDTAVTYTVELGTYENPADFDSTKFADMGPIRKVVTPSGLTRYTVGPFKTILDAELYRTRLASRDSLVANNSEVTIMDHGVRKTVPYYYKSEYKRRDYVPRTETRVVPGKTGGLQTTIGSTYAYDKIVEDKGTFQADGLSYKLELGSVKDSADFKLGYFAQYGKIEKKVYPDGTIRYSMGPFNTLKEAEDFKAFLMSKDSAAAKSIVTVFYFGQRKTVQEFFANPPCSSAPVDLAWFRDKSLNNPDVYAKFLKATGGYCADGLIYKVQIGAYRHPENFKYPQLAEFGPAEIKAYPDGITRFTMKEFKTINDAEVFRQICIKRGVTDAWITAVYKGERKTLEELIDNNFYGQAFK
ncbi:MAG: hypothetical protein Fur0041_13230 [Bacteroidia bacterium]